MNSTFYINSQNGKLFVKHLYNGIFKVLNHGEACPGIISNPIESVNQKCPHCNTSLISVRLKQKALKVEKDKPRTIEKKESLVGEADKIPDNEKFFILWKEAVRSSKFIAAIPFHIFTRNTPFFFKLKEEHHDLFLRRIVEKRRPIFDEEYTVSVLGELEFSKMSSAYDRLTKQGRAKYLGLFPHSVLPKDGLEIKTVQTYGREEKGVFATRDLPKDFDVGKFGGLVVEGMSIPSAPKESVDYIFEYIITDEMIPGGIGRLSIDPTRVMNSDTPDVVTDSFSWNGRINHKWGWDALATPNMFLPSDWTHMFGNASISQSLEISFTRPINKGEEIFIDYGYKYWHNERKAWLDWDNVPDTFIDFMTNLTPHKEWVDRFNQLHSAILANTDIPHSHRMEFQAFSDPASRGKILGEVRNNVLSVLKMSQFPKGSKFAEYLKKLPEGPDEPERIKL